MTAPAFNTENFGLVDEMAQHESRESFWTYRQYMNPKMIWGWWQREVALELHRFWIDYLAGKRPKLLLQSPPQHGKSTMVIDFVSWAIGQAFLEKQPDIRFIFASFSDRLGIRANVRLQRILCNPKHPAIFGTRILNPSISTANSQMIEFEGEGVDRGYFRNTTVEGQVTGESLDIGVIDDPIKGRAEANSQLTREKTWLWMTDDFMTRFSDKAGLLIIMTRWHLDDPAGRLMELNPDVRVCRYPALAEEDEEHRKEGEPLFPELKSAEFLDKQRATMTLAGWQSVYQQAPIIVGGDMFPIDKATIVREIPARANVSKVVRYWDKAGTHEGGAYSAGVLMTLMDDGTYCVVDVRRGRWGALEREKMIRHTARVDEQFYPELEVVIEQEPGSGGKESAEATVRMMAGYKVEADRVSGAKEVRADPFAAQWQAGNVRLVAAQWNREYLEEHECLCGTTEVVVNHGLLPIREVVEGDHVWTRKGWCRVTKAGKTGQQRLCEISISNGRKLRATLNHLIYVPNYGFKRVADLAVGESLLLYTGEAFSVGSKARVIFRDGLMGASNYCTELFTKMKLAQFRPSITFITATAIARIMQSIISSAFRQIGTWLCRGGEKQRFVLNAVPNFWQRLGRTVVIARENVGVWPMAIAFIQSDGNDVAFAGAGFISDITSPGSIFTVQSNARPRVGGGMAKSSDYATVLAAEKRLVRKARIDGFAAINARVEAMRLLDGLHDVYNLEVDQAHEFVAEGVLVHNCFPAGKYADQVDASSGAFNKLASKYRYDSSLSWVR